MNKIAVLNDASRGTFLGGRVVVTPTVRALPLEKNVALLEAVRTFNRLDQGNDPHGEHDFGSIELDSETYFFKVDYYDETYEFGSEDPADPRRRCACSPSCAPTSTETSWHRKEPTMSDQQPAFTAFAVTKREGKDDWWTPIGAAFPHKDGSGYNIVLQTIPLDGKIVLRPPKKDDENGTERDRQTVREENDRRRTQGRAR